MPKIKDLLGLQDWDIPFLYEELGIPPRTIEEITLTDEERTTIFESMRADRLKRNGEVEYSRETVLNSVVNSKRLSGVDARAWARERLAGLKEVVDNGSC